MKKSSRWIAIVSAAAMGIGVIAMPATAVTAQAAAKVASTASYNTQYTTSYSFLTLLKSALANTRTNADGIYEQIMLGFKYQTVNEADLIELLAEGYSIPTSVLQRLYNEGWISGYVYKTLTGQACTSADYKDVFDAAYYVSANPVIANAVASGAIPNDTETLFQNYLLCGVPLGLNGNATFDLQAFERQYPEIVTACNGDRLLEVQYYILHRNTLTPKITKATK